MNTKLLPNHFQVALATVPGITDLDKVKNLLRLWVGIQDLRKTDKKLAESNQQFQTEFNGTAPKGTSLVPPLYPENIPLDTI